MFALASIIYEGRRLADARQGRQGKKTVKFAEMAGV
jgi:hypothetical protein